MYKITTSLTYYAPDGRYCNLVKGYCRFCIINKGVCACALYNVPLTSLGKAVFKTNDCAYSTKREVVEVAPSVDLKLICDTSVDSFVKIYNDLRNQGLPEVVAMQAAKKAMKEGVV
jgi:hypothetical protein